MGKFVKIYSKLISKYPVTVQSVQTGVLMITGDILAQTIVEKRPINKIELKRTAQFSAVGFLVVGPCITTWYRFLSKILGDTGKATAVKKMALDQLCFAPCFITVFMATLNTFKGKTFQDTKTELEKKYFDILKNNYKLWPPVQIINFYFVPLQYQVLLVQVVALYWNTYLSWKTQQK